MPLQRNSLILIAAIIAIFMKLCAAPGQTSPAAQTDRSAAWVTASRFVVKADGKYLGAFRSLSGMASGLSAREWNGKAQRNFGSVTLSGGELKFRPIFETWQQQAVAGKVAEAHRNVTITAYDVHDRQIARYRLSQAWPIKVSKGQATGTSREIRQISVDLGYSEIQLLAETEN